MAGTQFRLDCKARIPSDVVATREVGRKGPSWLWIPSTSVFKENRPSQIALNKNSRPPGLYGIQHLWNVECYFHITKNKECQR